MYLIEPQIAAVSQMGAGEPTEEHLDRVRQESVNRGDMIEPKSKTRKITIESGSSSKDYCHVCGDLASGVHFGVFSCEGCKVSCNKTQISLTETNST